MLVADGLGGLPHPETRKSEFGDGVDAEPGPAGGG